MTAQAATARKVIHCDECRTPVAEVREQGIVIKSRHRDSHVTIITWAEIRRWLAEREGESRAA